MEAKQFVEETCMDNVSGAKGVMEAKKNLRDIYATDNVSGAKSAMEAKVFF